MKAISPSLKLISDLDFGFTDATNYRNSENRQLFNRVFLRTAHLDSLCKPHISFLVGEKGTGKTAYAVYLANNNYLENAASVRQVDETDYDKFVTLKRKQQLDLSDFKSIWKVILSLLIASNILKTEKDSITSASKQMTALREAVEEYNSGAFSSEIGQALQLVQENTYAVELMMKHLKASGGGKDAYTLTGNTFQTNLFYIQKEFEKAFGQLKPERNHILFIDGIDLRPFEIPYKDYLDCVRGLANAIWDLNNFFSGVRGGRGRLRVVLLVRPDIFSSLNLHNSNAKLSDNSVYLKWTTEYASFRTSEIFKMIDQLLESQQDHRLQLGRTFDSYFPWDTADVRGPGPHTAFVSLLRNT